MEPTGTCEYMMTNGEVCGEPTNMIFPDGSRQYWFCQEHLKAGAEQIIGRSFKGLPKLDA
jgi:hypothetical protein